MAPEQEVVFLFDHYRAALRRFLCSTGLRPQDVDEIVQESYLALFEHLRAGKPRDNLRAWLFQVAHHQSLKLKARNQRWFSAETPEPVDGQPNPEQQAATGQMQAKLFAIVAALPARERACLTLRAEGFRYREIAEILGISLGSVALSFERASARLQAWKHGLVRP